MTAHDHTSMTYITDEELEQARRLSMNDPKEAVSYIEGLIARSSPSDEITTLAELYYQLGSAYFDLFKSRQCANNVLKSITYYKELEDWSSLAQCYNVLGISYTYQGDNASAIDAFSNELTLGRQHDLLLPQMKAYINLGTTCYEISRYNEAMEYSTRAMEIYKGNEQHEQVVNYRIVYLSLLSKVLARQGRINEAADTIDKLDALLKRNPHFENTPFNKLPRFFLQLNESHDRVSSAVLDDIMAPFKEQNLASDYIFETIELMEVLQRLGEFDRLRDMFPVLDKALQPTDYYGYKLMQSRFKIEYCRHTNDTVRLLQEIGTFCDCVDKHSEVSSDTIISYLHAMSSLHASNDSNRQLERSNRRLERSNQKLEAHNHLLQQYANTDELTQIPNRRDLNETADQRFEQAKSEKVNFGFEMLDIDNFKLVNDNHGHDVGDKCLQLLADILRDVTNEQVYCARYGGDEFVLLYFGMTDEAIRDVADRIHDQVIARSGQKNMPAFTVSQGICNRKVRPKEKLWDLSSAADDALYTVKEGGRNATLLVN